MPQKVLNEDWNEYDKKKIRGKPDSIDFACTEEWEIKFLVEKIQKNYPQYPDARIRAAIAHCCKAVPAPHPRKEFVTCVMNALRTNA